jgi:hypothetical protein
VAHMQTTCAHNAINKHAARVQPCAIKRNTMKMRRIWGRSFFILPNSPFLSSYYIYICLPHPPLSSLPARPTAALQPREIGRCLHMMFMLIHVLQMVLMLRTKWKQGGHNGDSGDGSNGVGLHCPPFPGPTHVAKCQEGELGSKLVHVELCIRLTLPNAHMLATSFPFSIILRLLPLSSLPSDKKDQRKK